MLMGCSDGTSEASKTDKEIKNEKVADTEKKPVKQLKIGTTRSFEQWGNFAESGAYSDICLCSTVQMPFWRYDVNQEVVAGFVEEWEISEDNTELLITFPTNAMWHDGKPVTAEDVKFTFDYHRDVVKNDYTSQLQSTEIVSENQVRLIFSEPAAFAFLYKCADFVYVVPKHIWENVEGDSREYFEEGGGNGWLWSLPIWKN